MRKSAAKKVNDKRERAKKDVNKSLPVAVIPLGDCVLILAASRDYRRRIKRALDRVATISFGSEGFDLQKMASAEAKAQVFQEVSYENVTAVSVAERLSGRLRRGLKHPNLPEIDGALILIRLDLFNSGRDEIVVLSYDGSMSFASYFFSGTNDVKKNFQCKCNEVKEDCVEQCATEDAPVTEKGPDENDDEDDESEGMGKALPAFEEFIASTGPDNQFSVFDVVEKFGTECAVLFGKDIYIQCVQMDRRAAQLKQFDQVFETMYGPWDGLKKEIRRFQKELKKQDKQ